MAGDNVTEGTPLQSVRGDDDAVHRSDAVQSELRSTAPGTQHQPGGSGGAHPMAHGSGGGPTERDHESPAGAATEDIKVAVQRASTPSEPDPLPSSQKTVLHHDDTEAKHPKEPAAVAANADAFASDAHGDTVSELPINKNGVVANLWRASPTSPLDRHAVGEDSGELTCPKLPNGRSLARRSAPLVIPPNPPAGDTATAADELLPRCMPNLARVSAPPNLTRNSAAVSVASAVSIQSVRHVEHVPRRAVRAALAVSVNALLMAAAEVVIEVLILAGVYPKIPFRLDFFFLTLLSALLGYHTLHSVRQGHFDTSRNALQVGGLVEAALIVGDITFMMSSAEKYPASVPTRMPFLVLTAVNLALVIFLYVEMYRFHKREEAAEREEEAAEPRV